MQLVGRIDVDSRETDLAPEPAAGGDAAIDEVRARQGRSHGPHRPFLNGIADERTGDADAADLYLVDSLHREAVLLAGRFQFREIAFASGAETEVASDADVADLQRGHQEFGDETIGGPTRKVVRERDNDERVDAHVAQQLVLLREREDLRRDAVRRDDRKR